MNWSNMMTHPNMMVPFPPADAVMSLFMQTFCVCRASPVQPGISPAIAQHQCGHRGSLCSSPCGDHPAAGPFCKEPELGVQADGEEKRETRWRVPEAQETGTPEDSPSHSHPRQCPVTPQQSWRASGKRQVPGGVQQCLSSCLHMFLCFLKNKTYSPIWRSMALEFPSVWTETLQWPVNHSVGACVYVNKNWCNTVVVERATVHAWHWTPFRISTTLFSSKGIPTIICDSCLHSPEG